MGPSIATVTAMDDGKFMESTSLWIWSERDAGILWEPQGLVEMTVIKYVPEPTDDLTIGPRLIRKHTLHRSQRECGKRVAAAMRVRQPKRLFRLLLAAFDRLPDLLVLLGHLCEAVLLQTLRSRPVPFRRLLARFLRLVLGRHRLPFEKVGAGTRRAGRKVLGIG